MKELTILWSLCVTILLILFLTVDVIACKTELFEAKVVDKHYQAESNRVGTGTTLTNGKIGLVTVSEFEPEKYLLIVETEKNIITIDVKPQLYYQKQIGQKINCKAYKGYFTGINWMCKGVN